MRIEPITTKAYRGGGRRCFSRKAAYRHAAKALIWAKYPCQCTDDPPDPGSGYPGYPETCERHQWPAGRYGLLVRRFGRFLAFLDRRDRQKARVA